MKKMHSGNDAIMAACVAVANFRNNRNDQKSDEEHLSMDWVALCEALGMKIKTAKELETYYPQLACRYFGSGITAEPKLVVCDEYDHPEMLVQPYIKHDPKTGVPYPEGLKYEPGSNERMRNIMMAMKYEIPVLCAMPEGRFAIVDVIDGLWVCSDMAFSALVYDPVHQRYSFAAYGADRWNSSLIPTVSGDGTTALD